MHRVILLLSFALVLDIVHLWSNDLDRDLNFECHSNEAIHYIESYHNDGAEDRRWKLGCTYVGRLQHCRWSGYVNELDQPFAYQCSGNGFITGIFSQHDNDAEDRKHDFKCCQLSGTGLSACYQTGFTRYDDHFTYDVPRGYVLRGVTAIHDNDAEDRIFNFMFCRLSRC